jgi:hypothetical protein
VAALACVLAGAGAAPAQGAVTLQPGSGTLTYSAPDSDGDGLKTLRVETTTSPARLAPGEPVRITSHQTRTVSNSTPNGCIPQFVEDFTQPLESFPVARQPAQATMWDMNNETGVPTATTDGTYRQRQEYDCPAPTLGRYVRNDWNAYTLSGEMTSSLGPGCYRVRYWNEALEDANQMSGTIATFTIGDAGCGQATNLTVTADFDRFGGFASAGLTVVGTDTARVTGDAAALAQVARVCAQAYFTATVKLKVPTSTPMFWNGAVGPFENPDWTLVSRPAPNAKSMWKATYTEQIRIAKCAEGAGGVAIEDDLLVTAPGVMQSVAHHVVATAYNSSGAVLASVATSSKSARATTKAYVMSANASQTVTLP